jgi:hypothetical protein
MTNQRRLVQTLILAAIFALALPFAAAAQGTYDPLGRGDYRRDNDYRGDRRNRKGDRRYDYDRRVLRDSVRRVKDRSDDFRKHLDQALDRSRYDGKNREDRINDVARDFRDAANRLKDHYDDGRNLNRSAEDARRLLQLGARIDRFITRNPLDGRIMSDWTIIRQDLRVIADIYGFRMSDYDAGNYRSDDRGYHRDVSYPPANNPWWRQFPF